MRINLKVRVKKLVKEIFSKQFFYDKYLIIALFFTIIINDILVLFLTLGNMLGIKQLFSDMIFIILLSIFIVITPRKRQVHVIFFFIYFFSFLALANYMYFGYFGNFLSIGQATQAGQLGDVYDSIITLLDFKLLLFLVTPILVTIFYFRNRRFVDLAPIHHRKNGFKVVGISLVFSLMLNAAFVTSTDLSRLSKMWNRELVVDTFGIYTYQVSDAFKVVSSKYLADVDSKTDASKQFNEYYTDEKMAPITNAYTSSLAGRDIYFIHYESAQNFAVDLSINGQEVTPTLNRLTKESVYFNNFNAQESYGTSSDTEFTVSTSMYPRVDGTVFNTDADKTYVTTEELLRDQGYDVYAFHGNKGVFWNRDAMLANMGYTEFYDEKLYEYEESDVVGYGINDEMFYEQTADKIAEIKSSSPNPIFSKLITLSNHHPFEDGAARSSLDLGGYDNKEMSLYLKSLNYADMALQNFFTSMDENGLLDNAVVVLYGDHDARLPRESYESLMNYNFETDVATPPESLEYNSIDNGELRDLKEVPFLIWTKDKKIAPQVISQVGGMIDVTPTINNLVGINNPYQMGSDLLNPKTDITVFPNGSWKNNVTYYDSSSETYYGIIPSEEEKKKNLEYVNYMLSLSANIIHYDLLKGKYDFKYDDEE